MKRNHADICSYEPSPANSTPLRKKTASPSRTKSQPSSSTPDGHGASSASASSSHPRRTKAADTGEDSAPEYRAFLSRPTVREDSFVGQNATASLVGDRAQGSRNLPSLVKDLRPILGLEGPKTAAYPFMLSTIRSAEELRNQFLSLLPRADDVIKYFHFYRHEVYVYSPIISDIDGFERCVRVYVEKINSFERDRHDLALLESLERDVAHIAVILATLASGSQYSDLRLSQRMSLSRDFSRKSFQCLRLANFLFRPSLETIQALVVLGTVLQNDGQSDGAWALLGLTVRLAQCLGLHTDRNVRTLPEEVQRKRKDVWNKVMWQDALMSLSYDRLPALSAYRSISVDPNLSNLNYMLAMDVLCHIGVSSLIYTSDTQLQLAPLLQKLAEVDSLTSRCAPQLMSIEYCSTHQERRSHLAFRLYSSFMISMLARPAFRSGPSPGEESQHDLLVQRGKLALCETAQAFLDLHALDVYARRAWGMIHQGLSSALLLAILGESKSRPEIVELQLRVIDVLSNSEEAEVSSGDVPTAWLSSSHVRALRALRSLIQNGSRRSSQGSAVTNSGTNTEAISATTSIPPYRQQETPTSAKLDPYIPWVYPAMTNELVFDPSLMNGPEEMPMDLNMAYFDSLYDFGKIECARILDTYIC